MPGVKGLIKANMKTYFKARAKVKSVDKAIDLVIQTRYPISETNREEIRERYSDAIFPNYPEEEKLKQLVREILFFEYPRSEDRYNEGTLQVSQYSHAGLNRFAQKIENQIDSIYESMRKKYRVS